MYILHVKVQKLIPDLNFKSYTGHLDFVKFKFQWLGILFK